MVTPEQYARVGRLMMALTCVADARHNDAYVPEALFAEHWGAEIDVLVEADVLRRIWIDDDRYISILWGDPPLPDRITTLVKEVLNDHAD